MPPQLKRDDAPPAGDPWLVMVYQAGDNNLAEDMVLALQDLAAGAALQGRGWEKESNSMQAPPPVETWVIFPPRPSFSTMAPVWPPPMTEKGT